MPLIKSKDEIEFVDNLVKVIHSAMHFFDGRCADCADELSRSLKSVIAHQAAIEDRS